MCDGVMYLTEGVLQVRWGDVSDRGCVTGVTG